MRLRLRVNVTAFFSLALMLSGAFPATAASAESETPNAADTVENTEAQRPSEGGAGDLLVTPTRVVLEGRKRTAEVTLNNRGEKEATYRITLERKRMLESGAYQDVDEHGGPQPNEVFADALVRYSPRQVTLKPGESQTVKFMMRAPEGTAAGEYRSHILFRAVPDKAQGEDVEQPAADASQISIRLIPVYGVSIPLIARQGELQASASLSGVSLDGKRLRFSIHRKGNKSVYGDISVTAGDKVVGRLRGVAVFVPNAKRLITMNLTPPAGVSLGGPLTVTYRERAEDGGKVLAETKVSG